MNICYTREHGEIVYDENNCPACSAIERLKEKLDEMTAERDALLARE